MPFCTSQMKGNNVWSKTNNLTELFSKEGSSTHHTKKINWHNFTLKWRSIRNTTTWPICPSLLSWDFYKLPNTTWKIASNNSVSTKNGKNQYSPWLSNLKFRRFWYIFLLSQRQGYLYMCGRDNKYRPIIVIDVKKVKDANLKEKTFCDLMGFFYQYVTQNCLLEGQIESWITITDLSKMGLFSLGGTVMDTIKFMSSHFRCRAHHNYLVNCPGSMTFLYGMIKSTLKEDQIAKITLCE